MFQQILEKLLAGEGLSSTETDYVVGELRSKRIAPLQSAALFTALSMHAITEQRRDDVMEALKQCAGREVERESNAPFFATVLFLTNGDDLSSKEADLAMEEILTGRAHEAEIAAFLAALRFKGETVDELVGFARAMRRHAPRIFTDGHPIAEEALVDTCGTGGDALGTFNISTATAFVVAGAGVRVAKHGNRSQTSLCGSADVLEQLGMRIDLPPERVARAIEEVGIGFLFAPAMHSATRRVAKVRRELKIRTVFNLLGPLTNPAAASTQVVGVYDAGVTKLMAQALGELGVKRAFVVHGEDGLDEISITAPTHVSELRDGSARSYTVTPEDFGVNRAPLGAIRGGDPRQNAQIIQKILGRSPLYHEHTPHRDIVLVNASAALVAAGRAADFREGARLAVESIDSGAARAKLDALIAFSQGESDSAQSAT